MNLTAYNHAAMGAVVGFNERLTTIGGLYTRKVEIFDGVKWNGEIIPGVPIRGGWTSLAVLDTLYIFSLNDVAVYKYRISQLQWTPENARFRETANLRSFYFNHRIWHLSAYAQDKM